MVETASLSEKPTRSLKRVKRIVPRTGDTTISSHEAPLREPVSRDSLPIADLSTLIDSFVITADIERHTARTLGNKRERLSRLLWLAEQRKWKTVGVRELQAFFLYLIHGYQDEGGRWGSGTGKRSTSPVSSGTVKTYHAAYRAFFRWCVREGELDICPMDKIKPPIDRPDQVQPFTSGQLLLLETAAKKTLNAPRDEAIHFLLLDTGLRLSEATGLILADIDFTSGQVRVQHGKGSKERFVPFGRNAKRALWNYVQRERRHADGTEPVFLSDRGPSAAANALTPRGMTHIIARLGQRAKLPATVRCSPHTYRHTFAIMSLRNGASIFSLKLWLGHESFLMVNRYLALSNADSLAAHRLSSPADRLKDGKGGR